MADFDLIAHIHRQRGFSARTFGPGARTKGVIEHIRKELAEIESAPADLEEWIDVVILALDGAWRAGHEPEDIVAALLAKQTKNEARRWPDASAVSPDLPSEHIRSCNRHIDCDAADEEARAKGRVCGDHCHDKCCEDCFGS